MATLVAQPVPTAAEAPTLGLEVAGPALGLGMTKSYELARTGQLTEGVPVIKVGGRYRVPTAALRRALALDA